MAGQLPDRPKCETHPYVHLNEHGQCLLCEGEHLARKDLNRRGLKRAMRFNFHGKRRLSVPVVEEDEHESGLSTQEDRTLAAVRELIK